MTSISDRCKTAREGTTPGPWAVCETGLGINGPENSRGFYEEVFIAATETRGLMYLTYDAPVLEGDNLDADLALMALAPEAADEVVRLTDALEDLAERFGAQIMRANELDNEEMRYMASTAQAMIWKILNQNGDTNDQD